MISFQIMLLPFTLTYLVTKYLGGPKNKLLLSDKIRVLKCKSTSFKKKKKKRKRIESTGTIQKLYFIYFKYKIWLKGVWEVKTTTVLLE